MSNITVVAHNDIPKEKKKPATASLHLDTIHSIGGIDHFDRRRFIVMHSSQTESEWDSPEMMEQFLNGWDVYLGREVGAVSYYLSLVKEDPNKQGFASLDHLKELGKKKRLEYSKRTNIHQYETRNDLVVSTHIHPFWPDGTKTKQGWAFKDAEATGAFLSNYLKEGFGDHGDGIHGEPKPKYLEIINEPEWELIGAKGDKATVTQKEIWEYHNVIAAKVKELNPDVKVGGFTDASPDHEYKNFSNWHKRWSSFMDTSGENMDFFSFHVYDKGWNGGMQALRKGAYMEAMLDMFEHSSLVKLGEIKPWVVSEFGAYDASYSGLPYSKARDWFNLKAFSSMLLNFLDRPQHIEKIMPYTILKALWYDSGNGQPCPYRLLREEGDKWVYTELAKFYEQWQNVRGKRVYAETSDVDLQVAAFCEGDKVHWVLHNLEAKERTVNLSLLASEGKAIESITSRQVHLLEGLPALTTIHYRELPQRITIDSEATVILEIDFTNELHQIQKVEQTKFYATDYLKPIQEDVLNYEIKGVEVSEKKRLSRAILCVGIGRDHWNDFRPVVRLNGKKLKLPPYYRGYDQGSRESYWGVLEIPVPWELLQKDNVVNLDFEDTGGHVSSMVLKVIEQR